MRILYSPLAALIITGIVGVICVSLYMNGRRIQQSALTVQKMEVEVASIEAKVNLVERNALEATSSTAKERIFRDELLLQKPGEFIVQIPDQPLPSVKPTQTVTSLRPWQQWQQLLF